MDRSGNYWLFPETEDIFTAAAREETSHQQRSGARQGIIGNAEHAGFP